MLRLGGVIGVLEAMCLSWKHVYFVLWQRGRLNSAECQIIFKNRILELITARCLSLLCAPWVKKAWWLHVVPKIHVLYENVHSKWRLVFSGNEPDLWESDHPQQALPTTSTKARHWSGLLAFKLCFRLILITSEFQGLFPGHKSSWINTCLSLTKLHLPCVMSLINLGNCNNLVISFPVDQQMAN